MTTSQFIRNTVNMYMFVTNLFLVTFEDQQSGTYNYPFDAQVVVNLQPSATGCIQAGSGL